MNYKYVNIEQIFERVYTNHPFTENDFQWTDALEWVGALMKLMKIPTTNVHKVCTIPVEGFKAEIPLDMFLIETIRESNTGKLMYYSGDPYFKHLHCNNSQSVNHKCLESKYQYKMNNNYIYTGFEEGNIDIAYYALPIDEKGFPLIPDEESIKRAIEWEIVYKIAYNFWITDKFTRDKFQYIEQQRNWYVAKAMNSDRVPDIGKMEAIKNFTLRLIPKINVLDNQFNYHPERKFNHNTNNFNQGSAY